MLGPQVYVIVDELNEQSDSEVASLNSESEDKADKPNKKQKLGEHKMVSDKRAEGNHSNDQRFEKGKSNDVGVMTKGYF